MNATKQNPATGSKPGSGGRYQAAKLDRRNPATNRHDWQADVWPAFPDIDQDDIDGPALDAIHGPAARRSDREISRLLDILDNLPPPAREEMERTARHG